MKMNFWKYFIRIVVALFALCATVAIYLIVAGVILPDDAAKVVNQLIGDMWIRIGIIIGTVVLFLLSGIQLFMPIKNSQRRFVVIHDSKIGIAKISFIALDALVKRSIMDNDHIISVTSEIVKGKNNGVRVDLYLKLHNEADIPTVTKEIQQKVFTYVKNYSGIEVERVTIRVVGYGQNSKTSGTHRERGLK